MKNLNLNTTDKCEIKMKNRAFTLIELVLVMVILGILTAVATLNYVNVTHVYEEAVAKSNLRVLKSAFNLYRFEHSNEMPEKLLSDLGRDNGLDDYLDAEFKKVLEDSSGSYVYSLEDKIDKMLIVVTGPNSFKEEIIISK